MMYLCIDASLQTHQARGIQVYKFSKAITYGITCKIATINSGFHVPIFD